MDKIISTTKTKDANVQPGQEELQSCTTEKYFQDWLPVFRIAIVIDWKMKGKAVCIPILHGCEPEKRCGFVESSTDSEFACVALLL